MSEGGRGKGGRKAFFPLLPRTRPTVCTWIISAAVRGAGRESSEQVSGGGEVDRISGGPSEVIGSVRRSLPSFLFLPENFQVTHRVIRIVHRRRRRRSS